MRMTEPAMRNGGESEKQLTEEVYSNRRAWRMSNAWKREKDRAIKKEREREREKDRGLNRFYFCGN